MESYGGVVVYGCRAVEAVGGGWGLECSVGGRVVDGVKAVKGILELVAERFYGVSARVEAVERELIGRKRYVLYKAVGVIGDSRVELRLPVLADKGVPLVAAAVVDRRPRLQRFGEVIESPHTLGQRVDPGEVQAWALRPAVYVAEGSPPSIHPGYIVVEYPGGSRRYSVEELHALAEELVFDFHCVTGWSVKSTKWIVVPLTKLLNGLRNRCWLVFETVTRYSTVVPCSLSSSVYLAVGADGGRLPVERGGPVRVVAPPLFGWKHAKWVTGVRVVERYVDGFWEARGYHERGLVVFDERFKVRNPEIESQVLR